MNQVLVSYMLSTADAQTARAALIAEGFDAGVKQTPAGPRLVVRVRKGTSDADTAHGVVTRTVGEHKQGPPTSPTRTLEPYREGL